MFHKQYKNLFTQVEDEEEMEGREEDEDDSQVEEEQDYRHDPEEL
jgi:hypothetical protein